LARTSRDNAGHDRTFHMTHTNIRITQYFRIAIWICILSAAVWLGGRLWTIAAHSETRYQISDEFNN
jgi:hypothetical protein